MALFRASHWQPSTALLHEQFIRVRKSKLNLDYFPVGVDNAHIDVLLEAALCDVIDALVMLALSKYMLMFKLLDKSPSVDIEARKQFQSLYATLSIRVAQQARSASSREVYQLFVLAVVKKIYLLVDQQLHQQLEELNKDNRKAAMQNAGGSNSKSHRRLSEFKQHYRLLRFLVSQEVLEQLHSMELQLRKQRKSILAMSWPVSEETLFNPLLHLSKLDDEESFIHLYPLVLIRPEAFRHFDAALAQVLKPILPDCPMPLADDQAQVDLTALRLRRDGGELPGYAQVEAFLRSVMPVEEYQQARTSWLDHPDNVLWLFEPGREMKQSMPWGAREWAGFQERLLLTLEEQVQAAGLMDQVAASAVLPDLYVNLGKQGSLRMIFEYLCGRRKKDFPRMLIKFKDDAARKAYQTRLEESFVRIRQASSQQRRQWLLQVLEGHVRLRRDLKLAWEAYRAMDLINLLTREEDLELSKANNLLQSFTLQQSKGEQPVIGHVILKADLRGSTVLINHMLENGLNPAAYFSENLFDPINTLLRRYGAEKVFIEGDAVILMILDKENTAGQVVARACGLANDIIHLVSGRNRENRLLGLPQLELGIGLSYVAEAPNYLFDEGRKITISPAINRADRLSSCSSRSFPGFAGIKNKCGVEVIVPDNPDSNDCGKDKMYRYNVNGVELDYAAFKHLMSELVLHKVRLSKESLSDHDKERFYIGRFPDLSGKTRWLMVRRGVMKRWDGEHLYQMGGDHAGYYYELVMDPKLTRKIRNRVKRRLRH